MSRRSQGDLDDRRALIVGKVLDLCEKLGRSPTWREIGIAVLGEDMSNGAQAYVLGRWGGSGSTKERLVEFREATEFQARPSGAPGHRNRIDDQLARLMDALGRDRAVQCLERELAAQ